MEKVYSFIEKKSSKMTKQGNKLRQHNNHRFYLKILVLFANADITRYTVLILYYNTLCKKQKKS